MPDGAVGEFHIARRVPEVIDGASCDARYIALYGGRGGGKSHFFGEELIERCVVETTRAACLREHQNSLRESVRQLLIDKIDQWQINDLFTITDTEIRSTINDSLIIFKGMKAWNAEAIKSIEGYDIAWVEEAQTFSARSLRILRPTLRKPGSQLWFSWNSRYETDAVDAFFRGGKPPRNAYIQRINWNDNPWLPPDLYEEMLHDYATDPDMARHVWGGGYEVISEASYYAKWIQAAEDDGRIGHFEYDRTLPVMTAWDIGVDDYTAIWFLQEDGTNVTILDYYETQNEGAEEIINYALPEYHSDVTAGALQLRKLGRDQPYRYGTHYFPHDVRVREWGAGARSRVETLQALGLKNIQKGANTGPEERINATRRMLPICRFNNTPRVRKGLLRLRRYSRRRNEQLEVWQGPLHDEHSHGADAFGEYAVNCPLIGKLPIIVPPVPQQPGSVVLPGAPKPRHGRRINLGRKA